jgi:flavin reductase (DIM6/NTAB) family NADH-FMN oxidoreductase RutF
VHGLLEPGPVVVLGTARAGRFNVMPMSWHLMMEFTPPLVGCVVSEANYSFESLRKSGECTLNIPAAGLLKKVVACGNVSGGSVDKFKKFGLTPAAGAVVKAPLVAECHANLECRVIDRTLVKKYNFFVLEIVKAWIDARAAQPRKAPGAAAALARARAKPRTIHHEGEGLFMIAGRRVRMASPKTSVFSA